SSTEIRLSFGAALMRIEYRPGECDTRDYHDRDFRSRRGLHPARAGATWGEKERRGRRASRGAQGRRHRPAGRRAGESGARRTVARGAEIEALTDRIGRRAYVAR